MLDLTGQRVLVLGLGLSGRSAAVFCAERGARVVAADERPAGSLDDLSSLVGRVEVRTGAPFPDPTDFDLVVPSPGVPPQRYREGARRVWGDIELAGRALSVPIVAVTGTNGKSTTVRAIEAMLRGAGLRARAAGNVGTAALDLVGAALDVAVLEVSSFQLETIEAFQPRVAVVLNVSPDHLDRHASFEAYVAAKGRIFENQDAEDVAIANADDPAAAALLEHAKARTLPFSAMHPLERGAWLDAGAALLRTGTAPASRFPLDGLRLLGAHNRENVLAALCAVAAIGAEPDKAWHALADFNGLPHRAERVVECGGVLFVDDSKATNPAAALRSIGGFDQPLVWIAGGRAKGLDLREMAEAAASRARAAVLIGEGADAIESVLRGRIPVRRAEDIEQATAFAAQLARPGDVVLLAPGCSSLDQFQSYAERGDRFQAAARRVTAIGGAA